MRITFRAAAALPLALALAAPAFAAERIVGARNASPDQIVEVAPAYEGGGETYGVGSLSVYTVRAEDFLPPSSAIGYDTVNTGGIYVFQTTTVTDDWWARVQVPAGSLIERIELQACDTTTTGQILFGLARMDAPAQTGSNVTAVGSTGTAATPGCAFFSLTPTATLQVDNRNKSYVLFVDWSGNFTSANKVAAFRVFYRLQVSPAPAVATFTDVPVGTPQHRFVEALVAAGITGGCGTGLYCPGDPVTRGQMAVFLSVALGLHFPN